MKRSISCGTRKPVTLSSLPLALSSLSSSRLWLADYARREQQAERAMETIRELHGKLRLGRELKRDEMNER